MGRAGTAQFGPPRDEERRALATEWRKLGRAATAVAIVTSPALFSTLYIVNGWPLGWSILVTLVGIVAFRGLIDVLAYRMIPRPSLYGADDELKAEDVVFRRRRWYWRTRFRRLAWLVVVVLGGLVVLNLILRLFGTDVGLFGTLPALRDAIATAGPSLIFLVLQLPLFFLFNFLILFGPLLAFGILQMKAYEPGDADWGVKLEDVRGQKEPKEEVHRIITLWQAGDEFKKAGGKPERGLLLIGAPGTGKTMLSKAIATSFNSPIMTMPGSGFAQTFIGMDVIVVMIMIWRARRLARKWGGTCMIFIDEIDAVGMRRAALGGAYAAPAAIDGTEVEDYLFHGPWGALTSSGDLIRETRAWRERVFDARAESPRPVYPPALARIAGRVQDFIFPGGMMGGGYGQLALNQLLVQMDGMDNPPFFRKYVAKKFNTFLDALYIVPQRIGSRSLRLRPPKPRTEQVYFIGATNVPIERLDPALIRPGRMGRHIWFRTPTKDDRRDIFDLYLDKVAHDPDLDTDRRRNELARITGGYSPAMIEQVCSMALTYAHSDGRPVFEWGDIIEAMTTIEAGTAQGIEYAEDETRAIAIHEAGHAVAAHVYCTDQLSTRLSIRKRGGSLGHHQAIEIEERFSHFRHAYVADLVWTLGAMAAEHVFYGENSRGVSGDVGSATTLAALMVGVWSMGPEPIDFNGSRFATQEEREAAAQRCMDRFERVGLQIMNRSRSSREQGDAVAAILSDPAKRIAAATILGQCYLTALCLIRHNREEVARIAEVLVRRKELHGDEVVELLEAAQLEPPHIDLADETIWPKL